jgi:hypothetical protein
MSNRILVTVKGYENAVKEIALYAESFNNINGAGRMVFTETKLEVWDEEGSGEFFKAVCLNMNTAESCADEIWQIETCW